MAFVRVCVLQLPVPTDASASHGPQWESVMQDGGAGAIPSSAAHGGDAAGGASAMAPTAGTMLSPDAPRMMPCASSDAAAVNGANAPCAQCASAAPA